MKRLGFQRTAACLARGHVAVEESPEGWPCQRAAQDWARVKRNQTTKYGAKSRHKTLRR
jgi:hypothetical protein